MVEIQEFSKEILAFLPYWLHSLPESLYFQINSNLSARITKTVAHILMIPKFNP